MSSPFVGAWEVVSDVSEGFWVFTETHYSLATMQKNRKRFQGSEPTQEEAAEAYRARCCFWDLLYLRIDSGSPL